ncbi:MAG: cation:proton antiporter, partial [Kiritimatiellales bacterium]|nr:cation:proton antiporter [Kiritimatiellales bacterium]
MGETVFFEISLILISCAVLSWLALVLRQPLIVAYMAGGFLLGVPVLGLIRDTGFLDGISGLGITLLLFLAGLVLHPRRLRELFRQTLFITLVNSLVTFLICGAFCLLWGFSLRTSILTALPLIFSSTILVLKLLPTTALHHKRMGAYCIAILITQDLIAIALLIFLNAKGGAPMQWLFLPIKGILLVAAALIFEQVLLRRIMTRCSHFHETLQLLALGWCLLIALLSHAL